MNTKKNWKKFCEIYRLYEKNWNNEKKKEKKIGKNYSESHSKSHTWEKFAFHVQLLYIGERGTTFTRNEDVNMCPVSSK